MNEMNEICFQDLCLKSVLLVVIPDMKLQYYRHENTMHFSYRSVLLRKMSASTSFVHFSTCVSFSTDSCFPSFDLVFLKREKNEDFF